MTKEVVIITGANRSGKTTFARSFEKNNRLQMKILSSNQRYREGRCQGGLRK